jgi:hypothetical protein
LCRGVFLKQPPSLLAQVFRQPVEFLAGAAGKLQDCPSSQAAALTCMVQEKAAIRFSQACFQDNFQLADYLGVSKLESL